MEPSRPPVRLAHLGLGAFHRAHQAWYTQAANAAGARRGDRWGIAAFTGSSAELAEALERQDDRYGLICRAAAGDTVEVVESIVSARPGTDEAAWLATLADPAVSVLTLTVTEAGYVAESSVARRLVAGLAARRTAGAGPLAIVACDNVDAAATKMKELVLENADDVLSRWISDRISFVLSMVDRITPAATPADIDVARALLGWDDAVPVVTEPFSEWVLQGDFPAGRPEWERGGAQFVEDVSPYENRKLWMLNGAHSLLAYRGLEAGHRTVFEAWSDATLRAEVEQLWSEAREVLELPPDSVDAWLASTRHRFENPRIEHRLAQIARGGEQKIPARIGAVERAREAAGLPLGIAGRETVAAWKRYESVTGR